MLILLVKFIWIVIGNRNHLGIERLRKFFDILNRLLQKDFVLQPIPNAIVGLVFIIIFTKEVIISPRFVSIVAIPKLPTSP